jgi:hypothetical protein
MRVVRDNQSNFPGTWPMFDIVFTLNCVADGFELLEIDETLQSVTPCKPVDQISPVFMGTRP